MPGNKNSKMQLVRKGAECSGFGMCCYGGMGCNRFEGCACACI